MFALKDLDTAYSPNAPAGLYFALTPNSTHLKDIDRPQRHYIESMRLKTLMGLAHNSEYVVGSIPLNSYLGLTKQFQHCLAS